MGRGGRGSREGGEGAGGGGGAGSGCAAAASGSPARYAGPRAARAAPPSGRGRAATAAERWRPGEASGPAFRCPESRREPASGPRAAPMRAGEEPPPSAPRLPSPAAPASFSSQNPAPPGLSAARLVSAFCTASSRAGEGRLRGSPPHAAPAGDPEAGRGRLGRFHSPRGPGPPRRLAPLAPRRVRCCCRGSAPSLPEPRGLRGVSASAGRGPGLPVTAPPPAGVSCARAGARRAEAGAAAQGRTRSAEEGVNGSGSDRDLGTRRATPHPRRGSPGLQGGAAGDGWGGMGGVGRGLPGEGRRAKGVRVPPLCLCSRAAMGALWLR